MQYLSSNDVDKKMQVRFLTCIFLKYGCELFLLSFWLNILQCLTNLVAYTALDITLHSAYKTANSLCR